MNTVTVGANRRLPVAARDCLTVDALYVLLLDVVVTLGASYRNIEFVDWRFRIGSCQDVMLTMAIRTNGGLVGTRSHRFAVNTLLVRSEGSGTNSARCHHKFLAMAGAAGLRNVAPSYF